MQLERRTRLLITTAFVGLLALIIYPLGTHRLEAIQHTFDLSAGDSITLNCPTRLQGRANGQSTIVRCITDQALPTGTALPATESPATPTASAGGETPVAGELCPAWVHDRYVTSGPDGATYPTWHPPVDPEYGCLFGHEHGDDPRSANADSALPAFGYAAILLGIKEPHAGFKVFVINAGDTVEDGRQSIADYRVVFHMGTGAIGRYTARFHSMEYDYIARDGSGREAHVYGMADTTDNPIGSTCSTPRRGGRDFSTVGCPDAYEIWPFSFKIIHPDDPFTGEMEVRSYVSGAVAAFDPITTVDPNDLTQLIFTQDYRRPGSGIDPMSPQAEFQGCKREIYGGPNYWNNAGKPTVYYTDPMGQVMPGPGPGLIRQEVSAVSSRSNELYKLPRSFCGNGIRWPN